MTVDEVRVVLGNRRSELSDLGVLTVSVSGSVARGEAGPDSDVDLLVDLDPGRDHSLLDVAHIVGQLEAMLGQRVDLVEPECLREEFREEVLREAVRAA